MHRRADHDGNRKVVRMQVAYELRRANQVVDPQTHVNGTLEPHQAGGLPIEPNDFVLAAQDDDPVGKRGRRAPQFAVELYQPLFVKLLATVQAHHLSDDVAPNAAEVGRIDLRTQLEPAVQAVQIEQLPAQVQT